MAHKESGEGDSAFYSEADAQRRFEQAVNTGLRTPLLQREKATDGLPENSKRKRASYKT